VPTSSRQMLAIAAAVLVIVAAAAFFFLSQSDQPTIPQTGAGATATTAAAAGGELMVPGPLGEKTIGDPKAPNVVIEYAALTCPHCQRFHTDVFPSFKEKYIDTGKVYFVFREFPLNPLDQAAVMLARCAPADKYFEMVDLFFEQQRNWAFVSDPKTALLNLAKQTGFNQTSFEACLTNQQILDGVNWVKNRADNQFDVKSTPTFFINGEKAVGVQTLEAMDKLLAG